MPRLGRLWRSGARRAEVAEAPASELEAPGATPEPDDEGVDIGRRIEAARRRLRETIPPQEDPERPQT